MRGPMMSIASAWRGEKGPRPVSKRGPASAEDRISARVIEATSDDEVDVGDAMKSLAPGVRKRVTFRRLVTVPFWFGVDRHRQTFDELPKVVADAGTRGTIVAMMVDGRDMVKLDDGRRVFVRMGEDCKLLGRWCRFVDWLYGRVFS